MPDFSPPDIDHARIEAIAASLGLDMGHLGPWRQIGDALRGVHAAELADACLARLPFGHDGLLPPSGDFTADFRQGWIDYILSLGQDFSAPSHCSRRMAFSAACARAGVPLGLLHLQHGLIQRAVVERIVAKIGFAQGIESMIDHVMMFGALETYLMAEGYHSAKVDALQKALDESRMQVSQLQRKASIDQLTGLVTYSSLMEELEQQIKRAEERNHPLCVMMADLDFFKKVNDSHGHVVGDLVLRHAAERVKASVRDFDIVGRFGGEEFTVILANTDIETARVIAERIREEIAATPFHVHGLQIGITISVGAAMLRKGETREALLERADAAMYDAKQTGRNRVVFGAS